MMRRRGRPILRTAAVVGTATAVSGGVRHHQDQKYAAAGGRGPAAVRATAPAVRTPPPAAAPPDDMAQLTKLAELHSQGILTDEEFAAKKAQILGI